MLHQLFDDVNYIGNFIDVACVVTVFLIFEKRVCVKLVILLFVCRVVEIAKKYKSKYLDKYFFY